MDRPHKNLDVWKLAMECVTDIYLITKTFPLDERFGLTDQLRRAAISIPSNIAEGSSRSTKKEFVNFLYMAQGSLSEIDTQLEISLKLGYVTLEECKEVYIKLERIGKMITGLIKNQKR
jgi:four helix bundle protein